MSNLNYRALIALLAAAFALALAGCDTSDSRDESVSIEQAADLELLRGVEEIRGSLSISCPDCTSLEALSSLTRVRDTLYVSRTGLVNLNGLESLRSVGELRVGSNDNLFSLSGLDGLEEAQEGLMIRDNKRLSSLRSLERITHARYVQIGGNDALQDLDGLGIQTVKLKISINSNNSLLNLFGLEGVTDFGDGLGVSNNKSLTTLDGLGSEVTYIGEVFVAGNPLLSSLSGLDRLESVYSLHFQQPDALRPCATIQVRDRIGLENIENHASLPTNCACNGEWERIPGNCP